MTNAERLAEIRNRYEAAKPWMAEDFRSDTEFILNHIDRLKAVVDAAKILCMVLPDDERNGVAFINVEKALAELEKNDK